VLALQVEISLQPWHAFKPDGVILFSDILTPLTGMNIPFDITAGKGPVIADPIRTMEVRGAGVGGVTGVLGLVFWAGRGGEWCLGGEGGG
jgi:hypothetical protein